MHDANSSRRPFFVVASVSVERGYPDDPLSVARERVSFTSHADRDEAVTRLFSELDADLGDGAALSVRKSLLMPISVPISMLASGCPDRWVSDRMDHLLRQAGANPGTWWRAIHSNAVGPLLLSDLDDAVHALRDGVANGPGGGEHGVAVLAMVAAGAASRARANGVIGDGAAERVSDLCKRIGTAAWEGMDLSELVPDVDALVTELDPARPEPETETQAESEIEQAA